jgi:hypothetical protein
MRPPSFETINFVCCKKAGRLAKRCLASKAKLTASHISARISREIGRTCGTSRQQSLADCVNCSAVEGRDRVGDVTLRPQRGTR